MVQTLVSQMRFAASQRTPFIWDGVTLLCSLWWLHQWQPAMTASIKIRHQKFPAHCSRKPRTNCRFLSSFSVLVCCVFGRHSFAGYEIIAYYPSSHLNIAVCGWRRHLNRPNLPIRVSPGWGKQCRFNCMTYWKFRLSKIKHGLLLVKIT